VVGGACKKDAPEARASGALDLNIECHRSGNRVPAAAFAFLLPVAIDFQGVGFAEILDELEKTNICTYPF
jgi:hypothetical protein